jgi:hypothetical protein
MRSGIPVTFLAIAVATMAGCATTGAIQPVSKSKSGFDGAVYSGETTLINAPTPNTEAYRVFNQGATGFVSLEANREDAEARATKFCEQRHQVIRSLQETVSKPPHILGNFPRVELVFECASKEAVAQQPTTEDKYAKLAALKKLLDDGTLTKAEFESEKSKLLSGR